MLPDRVRFIEPAPWRDVLTAPSRGRLHRALRRATRRHELASVGRIKHVAPGVWAVPVLRLREAPPPPPGWVRPLAIAAVVAVTLGGLGWLGWLVVSALVGVVAGGLAALGGAGLLGLVAVLFLASRVFGGGHVTEVLVRVRHR